MLEIAINNFQNCGKALSHTSKESHELHVDTSVKKTKKKIQLFKGYFNFLKRY